MQQDNYIEVLPCVDNDVPGHVRLVETMGNDLSVVRAARVSYNADWRAGEDEGKDSKLIDYLLKNGHTSPFEMVQFKFEVKAPIFVLRQWHRHRTQSYNEMSARYTELDEGFYVPANSEAYGVQSSSSKQARDFKAEPLTASERAMRQVWMIEQHDVARAAFRTYKRHILEGMPRELARSILPVSAYSRMQVSIDLHNLFHFLKLRLHPHAQHEIRVYAEAMLKLIEPTVPVSVAAFRKHVLGE